ncbi:ribonuclease P protein component [Salipiger sp. 1_MG-2023]|uniref:ribonuclease P protein component n=1 Tax=Salipiger sp. 1_MG-2023 TaxID=3062665 RepID=UPI0026E3402F|nr:ribonuclease P protein component [Salipiger sp. 1_MG-2023]MDO6587717.1 ribonuclease P protein component [Salipiger sp. 1_MG-2023]
MTDQTEEKAAPALSEAAFPLAARRLEILRKRPDYLAAARADRAAAGSFMLQARRRDDGNDAVRVGFTCSKKVGNAVARNRAKRRLREIARLVLAPRGRSGWDYVLIGWKDVTADRPFDLLCADLEKALQRVHSGRAGKSPDRAPRRRGRGA